MTVHEPDATAAPAARGLGQKPPLVTSQMLAGPRDRILEAQAENDLQEKIVYDPSPERDSLVEHLVALPRPDVDPVAVAADMTQLVRVWLESNRRERGHQHAAVAPLDSLTTLLHAEGLRSALTIKDAARRLRDPLKTIRQHQIDQVDTKSFFLASGAVKDVIGELPVATLRGGSLRNQLGTGLHDVLCDLLTDGAGEATGV